MVISTDKLRPRKVSDFPGAGSEAVVGTSFAPRPEGLWVQFASCASTYSVVRVVEVLQNCLLTEGIFTTTL